MTNPPFDPVIFDPAIFDAEPYLTARRIRRRRGGFLDYGIWVPAPKRGR